jgi:hypothetical protein
METRGLLSEVTPWEYTQMLQVQAQEPSTPPHPAAIWARRVHLLASVGIAFLMLSVVFREGGLEEMGWAVVPFFGFLAVLVASWLVDRVLTRRARR